jgi:hypothetical protein
MSASQSSEPGRLNGWKEIAAHLGKGTRTAQRWEKVYGLPVHRIGREGGEIVFPFRDEIDTWAAAVEGRLVSNGSPTAAEAPGPAPAPVRAVGGAGGAARSRRNALPTTAPGSRPPPRLRRGGRGRSGLILWLVGRRTPTAGVPRQPAEWRIESERLFVLDVTGTLLFEHTFDFPVQGSYRSEPGTDVRRAPVQIVDIDGDGRSEVLVTPVSVRREDRRLYCFESDGRQRFVHQPGGSVRFGDTVYEGPWLAHRVFVTGEPGGARRLWAVFTHNLWFPARLQELAPDGSVLQEYWSDGYIDFVAIERWKGRSVLLAGGTNNDFKAASLAIFDPDRVAGAAPARPGAYACHGCPAGGPEELLLFPSLCLPRASGAQATVEEAWVEGGTHIKVAVTQSAAGVAERGDTYYTVGPDLHLTAAEISGELQLVHRLAEKKGLVDHPFGAKDDVEMFPVRRWDGRRFVDLPTVPVSH